MQKSLQNMGQKTLFGSKPLFALLHYFRLLSQSILMAVLPT
jgi:hypothetical protein